MTFADTISRDTQRYNPEIERLPDGDIIFHWRIWQTSGPLRKITIARLAELTGIDDDLFYREHGFIKLHIPAEIAGCNRGEDSPATEDSLRPSPSAKRKFEFAATAYAKYLTAIGVACGNIAALIDDAPAPSEDFAPDWSHVGTLARVNGQLGDVLAAVAEFVNTPLPDSPPPA